MFNQPQTIDPAALMAQVAQAKVSQGQFPFIAAGNHSLVLANYEQKNTEKGPCVFAYFVYAQSSDAALVGSLCTKMWKLYPGKFPDSLDKELGDMKAFVIALGGTDDPAQVASSGTALLAQNAGRGMVIKCNGVPNSKGNYVATYFDHVKNQTAESIAQCLAQLETSAPMSLFTKQAPAQVAAPPAAAAPASNFLGTEAPAPAAPVAAPASPFNIPGL